MKNTTNGEEEKGILKAIQPCQRKPRLTPLTPPPPPPVPTTPAGLLPMHEPQEIELKKKKDTDYAENLRVSLARTVFPGLASSQSSRKVEKCGVEGDAGGKTYRAAQQR